MGLIGSMGSMEPIGSMGVSMGAQWAAMGTMGFMRPKGPMGLMGPMGIMGAIKPDWLMWPDRGEGAGIKFLNTARPDGVGNAIRRARPNAVKRHQRKPCIVYLMRAS